MYVNANLNTQTNKDILKFHGGETVL